MEMNQLETIAFPKNNSGYDVMIKAPSEVDPQQLDDLGILKIR